MTAIAGMILKLYPIKYLTFDQQWWLAIGLPPEVATTSIPAAPHAAVTVPVALAPIVCWKEYGLQACVENVTMIGHCNWLWIV
jgi:hypothetical protein